MTGRFDPRPTDRLAEIVLRGETVALFALRERDLPAEPDPSFRAAFPEAEFWAPARRRDFRLGRTAARAAILAVSGVDPGWLPAGADGRPGLPAGIAASLTHSELPSGRIALVAVARAANARLGIDLEPVVSAERFAKLSPRFVAHLPAVRANPPLERLDPETLTELFAIYEAAVKAIAQYGWGKPLPDDLRGLEIERRRDPDETAWKLRHAASGKTVEGRILALETAKIAVGIA